MQTLSPPLTNKAPLYLKQWSPDLEFVALYLLVETCLFIISGISPTT
ncbi:hypothetical protein VCHA56P521_230036 [Vibrio chagasii]|nr:hypothetical protein VCHA37O173_110036 [Vibrio chagasii]CAH6814105.1 hypothetical protein VCHA29O39_120176 [Vibrio chagasii]CAH6869163.1 hypothetical protein VCHA36P168_210036 [Vibrio chagasii]CAH6966835.1 hypothetical protein VCHA43P284_130037 [Vibrio chagasii]CAH6996171.1 hypothetical protein VCHA50O407_150109 [Vibrio chagasii]